MKFSEIKYFIISYDKIVTASTYEQAVEYVKDIYDSTCGPAWVFQKMHTIVDGKNNEKVYILNDEDFIEEMSKWEAKHPDEMVSEGD